MLIDNLKEYLADHVAYKIKSQGFHWNVEGTDFIQLHKLFGNIYEDADDATDTLAEYLRSMQEYAPASLKRYSDLTNIKDQVKVPNAKLMVEELLKDTEYLIEDSKMLFDEATADKQNGLANFIADRQSAFGKYAWQLRVYLQ